MPTVALVGRPNVGKSTLFNRLCGGRDALVADFPGLTRDRRYGRAEVEGHTISVVDTGGLGDMATADTEMADAVAAQVWQAVDEADVAVMLVDAQTGASATDDEIAEGLRRRGKPVVLVANKADGTDPAVAHDFWGLGLGEALPLSALRGRGMGRLRTALAEALPPVEDAGQEEAEDGIRVAIVGRPNVGKSTLVNRLAGSDRQVVLDRPGTTRDAIDIRVGNHVLIDTAGLRRRSRVSEAIEKFSVIKSLEALERAHVAVLLIDAEDGLVDQDLHLMRHAMDAGTGLLLAVNKWDGLSPDRRLAVRSALDRRMDFAPWVSIRYISARTGAGVGKLMGLVDDIHGAAAFDTSTPQLNRILEEAVRAHPPPMVHGRAIRLRYAHKAGAHPPALMLHGNRTEALPASYLRYLENRFRAALDLAGTPLRIQTRTGENPWGDRSNKLTERQMRQRRRLIRHRLGKR
ncbi:MAG: ribosome biogenesis GTPase Der [Gammaproteobacteria bacterium]|nr:ribosome biogenesis GTPase Der [Gammaproteobacteria bacterium]